MVSLGQRLRKVQARLLAIKIGSGAVVLPKDVKRIHMQFGRKPFGGHMGPLKFWRHELIRMKYHNPAVSMTVERSNSDDSPAVMSIHFAPSDARQTSDSATSSPAPTSSTTSTSTPSQHDATERVETINMKHFTSSEILDAVVRLTKAYPVEPSPDEREELAELERHRIRSEKDSKLSQEVRARVKREKELLEQARGDLAAQPA